MCVCGGGGGLFLISFDGFCFKFVVVFTSFLSSFLFFFFFFFLVGGGGWGGSG